MTDSAPMSVIKTDVLIVGTGPAGGSLASFLGYHGISGMIITKESQTAIQPRAHMQNAATWECLRDIGLEDECRDVSMSIDYYGDYRYCYTLAGGDAMRMYSFGCDPERAGDYENASPCKRADISQSVEEPLFLKYATHHGFQARFNSTFLRYEEDETTGLVTTTIHDQLTDTQFQVVSKFLCGADGAGSKVAAQLGLEFNTVSPGGSALNAWYEADLSHIYEKNPGMLHHILDPYSDAPLWGVRGLSRVVRPYKEFVMSIIADPSVKSIDVTKEEVKKRLHELIGDDNVEINLKGVYRYRHNESYAETASKGNIFCLGDAIHRHSPGKGLGSNTCIQDAYNLSWKMAYVLQGKAGAKLLDSYSLERQPIAKRVVRVANQSLRLHTDVVKVLGIDAPTVEGRVAALREFESATPAGAAKRAGLRKAHDALFDESSALGAEMNQAYHSGAVYLDDEIDPNPTWPEGSAGIRHHSVSTYPGSRLPHAWLGSRRFGERLSTHDLAGRGRFTVFTGIGGTDAWTAAAKAAADALGGDVDVVVRPIGPGQEFADMYYLWEDRRWIDEEGALLVRPDRTVAWRCKNLSRIADPGAKLTKVMKKILCRD